MFRALRLLVAILLFGSTLGVAHAQSGQWTVSEVSGRVTVRDGSQVEVAARGAIVNSGEVVETGPGSRAVVVRGKDFVTLAPNSRVRIPAQETREAGIFDVLQEWGNAIFQIEKKPNPHFGVNTPYLAAVVKGTTFSITVSDEGASLQVTEGAVETSTTDGGARELIRPGIVAIVAASDRYRLTVQGQETRVIDSPQRPATGTSESGGPGENQSSNGTTPGMEPGASPASESGPAHQIALSSEMSAAGPSVGGQLIVEIVAPEAANLGQLTGGLVGGATASQVSSSQAASTRDVARGPASGDGVGNGNGGGSGNGDGNNGNGNGNGGPNGNDPGNGNGNNGNGNGNGGPNGNDPGNGNGNNGNGNS